jgi:hypothetical protein
MDHALVSLPLEKFSSAPAQGVSSSMKKMRMFKTVLLCSLTFLLLTVLPAAAQVERVVADVQGIT